MACEQDKREDSAARRIAAFVAALSFGIGIGLISWLLLGVSYGILGLVWGPTLSLLEKPLFVFALCCVGGVAIAFWNGRFESEPKPFTAVMAEVKAKGGYSMGPFIPGIVSFMLPVVFGGSIGVAAGLVGIVATCCTLSWSLLDRILCIASLPKYGRAALKALIAAGIAAAFVACTFAMGTPVPLPRFESLPLFDGTYLLQAVLLSAAGWALSLLYIASTFFSKKSAATLADKPWLRPVFCGVALGAVGVFLPFVLFPGPVQVSEIMDAWPALPFFVLAATAAAKVFFTAFCMNMGWMGGPFFPLILAGTCMGVAIASVSGIDPVLAAISVSTALLGSSSRRPLTSALIMLIVCPVQDVLYIAVAAFVGAALPLPGVAKESKAPSCRKGDS